MKCNLLPFKKEMSRMRNLKIGAKLLLGFGMILMIFVITALLTWRNVAVAEKDNEIMVSEVWPSMELAAALNIGAYELFLAERLL